MEVNSLKELFVDQLQDIYDAENQLVAALPKMQKAAKSEELSTAFGDHLEQTKEHVSRLEQVFGILDEKVKRKTCKAMKGLVEEGSEAIKLESDNEGVIDAALIAAAQRVEHYEIAAYGTVRTFAEKLGYSDAVDILQSTLDEEGEADKKLTDIAVNMVNEEADEGSSTEKSRAR